MSNAKVNQSVAESKFDKFRERALRTTTDKGNKGSNDPFVLGEDAGFSPAIVLDKPSLKARMLLQDAVQQSRVLDVLRFIFGSDVNRFLDVLDLHEEETGENSELIMMGIIIAYVEHFYGEGSLTQSFRNLSI